MIAKESLQTLARNYQTSEFPNIVREYYQHLFLSQMYRLNGAEKLLFKGGTALRIVYGSPRFSEDLDFSLFGVPVHETKKYVEDIFVKILAEIESQGIKVDIGEKSGSTSGGYFGIASFKTVDYQPVNVEINISSRNGRNIQGEVDSVANSFVPNYTLVHLPQGELVEEKVFGALRERKKPRDYYDLYFIMRRGMLSPDQKKRLGEISATIISEANAIDFKGELGAFLPADQQAIIRDFPRALGQEMDRQLSSLSH